jgi:hypothetical protein
MMAQVDPSNDPATDPPPADPPEDPELSRRDRAKLEKDARDAKLETAMLRAGLDPEKGMDKLFFESYGGEITAEAVTEAAKGYGLIKEPDVKPGEITDPDERRQTGERQQTAAGASPDGQTPSIDPREQAIKDGQQVMANGGTQEAAMAAAFDTIAAAGYGDSRTGTKPDPRAHFVPGEPDPRHPDQGW